MCETNEADVMVFVFLLKEKQYPYLLFRASPVVPMDLIHFIALKIFI